MNNSKTKHTSGTVSIDMVHMRQTDEILLCRDAGDKGNGELVAKIYGDYSFALKAAAAPDALISMRNTLVLLSQLQDLSPRDIGTVEQIRESLEYVIAKATGGES